MKTRWLEWSAGLCLATVTALRSAAAQSEFAPPWHELPMVPLGADVQSLEVNEFDTPVWVAPGQGRRGSLLAGTRLPILGSRRPSGECADRWFLIGPLAWVCGAEVRPSRASPTPAALNLPNDGLSYRYYFVGPNGAFAYSAPSLVGEGIPDSQLEPGFAVAIVNESRVGEERIAQTTNGLWIPLQDLVPARPSAFEGKHLSEPTELSRVAWTVGTVRHAYDRPGGRRVRQLKPLTAVSIRERRTVQRVEWCLTEAGDWIKTSELRFGEFATPPSGVGATERWIDVDTKRQVLTAYVGSRPRFVTLVSTGKGPHASETATPLGEHRLWVKLAVSDMTNVEDPQASRFYAMEGVPWVQFFKGGYGLHAAFWHDSFGAPRSHGCVNLSPRDAAFLFSWTEPRLPTGWHAVHPTPVERGTLVRVR